MDKQRSKNKQFLSIPERCHECPVLLEAQGDAAATKKLCELGVYTEAELIESRQALRDLGYDVPLSDDERLGTLFKRTAECLGAVTLTKTIHGIRYENIICGSTEATVPSHQQGILFEPTTVRRVIKD